ncbi:hypothetical protein ABZW10_20705 [Kitasatospora sp. NPDC004723]|uniref:cyanobactin maturation protease PatG family protein n=1 Tax=Kitasatospora sp. NPDC004723 TaxID=3154288 RepID=UPI0033BC3CFF
MDHSPSPNPAEADGDGDADADADADRVTDASPDEGAPVYAVGRIGVDFRSEARLDGFRRQLAEAPGGPPPDPGDARQLYDHLVRNPWASSRVTWTLSLDSTTVYALEAEPAVGMDWSGPLPGPAPGGNEEERLALLRRIAAAPPVHPVHRALRDTLLGQSLPAGDPGRIGRLTVPGRLTGRSTRLFSGRTVPVVRVSAVGLARWTETPLIEAAVDTVAEGITRRDRNPAREHDHEAVTGHVRALLDKVYHQLRNPGRSAAERALNHAATEVFLSGGLLGEGPLSAQQLPDALAPATPVPATPGLCTLDTIAVAGSPYCRAGSDCQDVMVRFFDPADDRRAAVTYVCTVDVSDELPVSLGPVHRFLG